jgi:ribosomal protein S7
MSKHTSGPWNWSVESVDPEWAVVTDKSGGIVANVNSETGPDASSAPAMRQMPRDANARLIAAAPDMLEALREAEHASQELCNGQDPANECWAVLARIRAAIAKAEGGN